MAFQKGTRSIRAVTAFVAAYWLTACAGVPVVPPDLQDKVKRDVSFQEVKTSPLSHRGTYVLVGGTVLSVKPLKQNGTRIEILQLPLGRNDEPWGRLTDSHGRFFAFHKEFLDPATIPAGTRVTVVGEVTGSMTSMLEDIEYVYPTFDVAALTIWPPKLPAYWFHPYPYFGIYWGTHWGAPY